ncbi:unnamed protein product [Paramecium primaurelia]|uniref:Uncharacterized protein n=1 Tax=Paramecium primaurelia TaxID=5886 RepID=A0A8S1KW33_PARPR|nr:unnamed protein product [Paramecium primaurelia]
MRQQQAHIQTIQTMAARLNQNISNRRSILNDSQQIQNHQLNHSVNQSFLNSPKLISNHQSFIISQPTSHSMRDTVKSVRCTSPSLRVQTEKIEKEENKQQQFIDATLRLLAQNEKLEKLICEQNEVLAIYKQEKQELEFQVKRLSQEITFLKDANQKRVMALEKELKQIKGKSQHQPKKFLR